MIDILVIEDNKEIGELLADFLSNEGYDCYLAETGEEGLEVFMDEGAKLVILDVLLPGMDGFAICTQIRKRYNTPIIFLSAKDTKEDKLNGIMSGADDYIEKPYDIDILLAKIKGIFDRRYQSNTVIDGNIRIDKENYTVYVDNEIREMTSKEIELLSLLIENKQKVMKKEHIFYKIWGVDSDSELQTVTVHINKLREKIERDPKNPDKIKTVWGVGYRYE